MQFLNDPIVFKILFYGFMLLGLATILTYLLSFLLPQSQTFPKVKKIIGGWWIISALLAFAVLLGQIGIVLLFLIASLIALKEFIDIQKLEFVKTREMVAMSLVTVVHYSFIILGWKNFFLFIVPLMSFIYLPFFFLARRKIDGLVQNLWSAQCGLMLCVYFLSFVPGLIFLNDNPTANRTIDPILAFFFLFFVTELNDVFQFICGKSFGRIKLIHEISPNKTLAGFLGGIFFTSLLSIAIAPFLLKTLFWQSLVLGISVSLSGMSGDLMFSSIKRTFKVKDFSELIPGHGGVLDRLDSIIFTAPTLYSGMYIFLHW